MTVRLSVSFCASPVLTHDMRDATDFDLVAASRRGEPHAFAEIVRRCANLVEAVAYAATRDRPLSEDIAQDTFVAAWCEIDRLRDQAALRPWLCKIARNLAHKARRRRKQEHQAREADSLVDDRTPYDAIHEREMERLVDAALSRIPTLYRETLVLFYYEQQSTKALASALGVGEDVVHQRLSRGRRYLAAALEQHVEATLSRRRSRRDLAACVLAAIALVPSHAHAHPRGEPMLKIGAVTIAAATVAITSIAVWPAAEAAPRRVMSDGSAVKPAAMPTHAARATPITADDSRCAVVARHIVAVSLAGLDGAADEHAVGVERVTEQLEARCRHEAWSPRETSCILASEYPPTIARCRPAEPLAPVDGPPAPVAADVDIACPAVGAHVADLMIETATLDDMNNVAAVALADLDDLPVAVPDACSDEMWSEELRRCYAAADRYGQIVACNLRWR
jgi:RNA polymerase sigma factor (sigma-70 family)